MAITIEKPQQENWNPTLNVRGLLKKDFFVISIDGMRMDETGTEPAEYGKYKSKLAFVDIWEYRYMDLDESEVVHEKLTEPVRCSYFMSLAIYNKIIDSKVPQGQKLKIEMTEKDGKSNWVISQDGVITPPASIPQAVSTTSQQTLNTTNIDTTQTTQSKSVVNGETVEEITPDFDGENLEALKKQIINLKNAKFDEKGIIDFLKGQYKEETILKVYQEVM